MRTRLFGIALSLLLLAGEAAAQGVVGPGVVYPYAGGGGGGSSTITSGTTATSGCVAGGVLRSISNLVECDAGITWSGGTLTLNNGVSAVSPLVVQDNGTPVLTVADGGITTFTQPIRAAAGTVAAPSFSFSGQTGSGFYVDGSGPHAVFNGTEKMIFSTQNVIYADMIGGTTNTYDLGLASNVFRAVRTTGLLLGTASDSAFYSLSAGVARFTDDTAAGYRALLGGGTAVASATALPLPTGRVFHVTGTTTITSITSTNFESGVVITLIFDGVLTFTDGSNLKLAGDFVTTADDTITLVFDGTNWHETGRSIN